MAPARLCRKGLEAAYVPRFLEIQPFTDTSRAYDRLPYTPALLRSSYPRLFCRARRGEGHRRSMAAPLQPSASAFELDYLTPNEFVARATRPAPQRNGRGAAVEGASRPVAEPPRRGQTQLRGKPSQGNRGPKNQGRSALLKHEAFSIVTVLIIGSKPIYLQGALQHSF